MCKAIIYVANPDTQTVAVGGVIDPGSTVRKYGNGILLVGNSIRLTGTGYYRINATFTLSPTAAGTAVISMFDGAGAVVGATTSVTTVAADELQSVSIDAVVRVRCACAENDITFVLTGAASEIINSAIVVEKV